eukprot:Hpha_TRINITY_DN16614_c1_g3::TRINITY_DN16614_c1_g3_i1::g.180765::m.180765
MPGGRIRRREEDGESNKGPKVRRTATPRSHIQARARVGSSLQSRMQGNFVKKRGSFTVLDGYVEIEKVTLDEFLFIFDSRKEQLTPRDFGPNTATLSLVLDEKGAGECLGKSKITAGSMYGTFRPSKLAVTYTPQEEALEIKFKMGSQSSW